jgi:hypothetical protein
MHEQSPSCPACDHRFETGPGKGLLVVIGLALVGAAGVAWMFFR